MRFFLLLIAISLPLAADWPDWRGPTRDGISLEKNLPVKWSPAGENLAWKAPFGSRSSPVVHNNRVYLFNTLGKGASMQERLMAFDADTGKVLWQVPFNVYLSDVPPHRVAWASPGVDPETGNIYVFGVHGTVSAVSPQGKVLWQRSLAEDMGLVTTHGGRTSSPVVEGDNVIVSGINSGWGDQARASHRFMAFDKRTGAINWVSSPGGRPFDTTYSPPITAEIDGMRLLIAGTGDGAVHAIKAFTGEPVWHYNMSKRGVNTGAVLNGSTVIVSHSEENLTTSDMGLLAALDAGSKGAIPPTQVKWSIQGFQGGFSSPVIDGERLYQVDNGANVYAFDVNSGKRLWQHNIGTIQKASPVLADGKLYVGSENGRFWVLKPGPAGCEVLDEDQLPEGEAIIASVAVSDGRVFLVTQDVANQDGTGHLYAIGKAKGKGLPTAPRRIVKAPAGSEPAYLQVSPTELLLAPGETVQLHARRYDAKGRLLGEAQAEWTLENLGGSVAGGKYTAASDGKAYAGLVKAAAGGLSGSARVRVIPRLPLSFDFETVGPPPPYWINATGKSVVRAVEGKNVLVKLADNPFTKRARMFIGPSNASNYTVEAEAFAIERRRQMGDAGVVAQRYQLTLFGNAQKLELQSWQPETERTVSQPFAWKASTWYRLKLRVDNLPDGKVHARGKVWPAGEAEPAAWTIEKIDPHGNREGSPGIYADATFEVFFDNVKVTKNQ
jgi:outer membrane protein assembly factor BamB